MKFIAAVSALIVAASCIREGDSKSGDLGVGDLIPDFSVEMNDGSVVTGEQLREGISIIVFFNTGCPDCAVTLPHVQKIYDEYVPKGVRFALISREEEYSIVSIYWKNRNMTMPFSAQSTRVIYNLFAESRIPRVYICKDGVIKAVFTDNPNPTYDDMDSVLKGLDVSSEAPIGENLKYIQ